MRKQSIYNRYFKNWWVHLILIVMSILAVFPIYWLFITSFKSESEVFSTKINIIPNITSLDNYLHVLTKKKVWSKDGKINFNRVLNNLETEKNADGSINLYITEFVEKGDTQDSFIKIQEKKINIKYLREVTSIKDLSSANSLRILFTLKKGSNPKSVAKKIYNNVPDYSFFRWIFNSFVVAISTTALGLFFASTTAYAFSRFNFWGKKVGLMSFLITQTFPGTLLIVPLYNILVTFGLLNSYGGLIFAYCTTALPFCVWMLKGFFDTIPKELEEAAFVEGLTPIGTYFWIVMPLSVPGLAVVAFFSFITAWNEYAMALAFMTSESMYTLPIGLTTFTHQFQTSWHYMAAAAILITIPVLIFFFYAQKYLVSGLTSGGVKE